MHGTLTLDGPGLVSARMENGAHIDAAIAVSTDDHEASIAGIEIEVTNLTVHLGEQPSYRGTQTISLSMRPNQLRDFLTIVAHKTGVPLFSEPDWYALRDAINFALDASAKQVANGELDELGELGARRNVARWDALKMQIEEALNRG